MHSEEYLRWLEKSGLKKVVENNYKYFLPLLSNCLAVKNEEIMIISDYGGLGHQIAPIMAGCYYWAAKEKGIKVKLILQTPKTKGEKADDLVVKNLQELSPEQVVIICLSNLLGGLSGLGKSYRIFCRSNKHKFASTTGMGGLKNEQFSSLIKAIDIDYKKLRENGLRIKRILDGSREIKVVTGTGTDLTMDTKGMEAVASIGLYNRPGLGGNMPTGEIYIPPCIGKISGKLVIDGSMRHAGGTIVVKEPVRITIKDGRVKDMKGPGVDLIEQTLKDAEERAKFPERVRLVGEFGIGINPGAEIIGSTILDEKTLGTAHIAIGSNYWFGGEIKTIIHIDQVFKNPEIYVDGKELKI